MFPYTHFLFSIPNSLIIAPSRPSIPSDILSTTREEGPHRRTFLAAGFLFFMWKSSSSFSKFSSLSLEVFLVLILLWSGFYLNMYVVVQLCFVRAAYCSQWNSCAIVRRWFLVLYCIWMQMLVVCMVAHASSGFIKKDYAN